MIDFEIQKSRIEMIRQHALNTLSVHAGSVDAQDKLYLIYVIDALVKEAPMIGKEQAVIDEAIKWSTAVKVSFGPYGNIAITPILKELFMAVQALEEST